MSTLASPKLPPSPPLTLQSAPGAGPWQARARRALPRRYINILINLTLLGLVVMSFVTGWVASILGLTEFGLHKFSSIALIFVAAGHVVLHRRSLTVQLRNLGTSRYDRRNPAQYDRRIGDRRVRDRRPGPGPSAVPTAHELTDRRTEMAESA